MFTLLPFSRLLPLAAALLLTLTAQASHFLGGQLTYAPVAGVANRYKFTLRVYRDCGGATLYTTATFRFRSNGCGITGATGDPSDIVSNLVGGSTIGSDYCATATGGPSPCGSGLPTNYETGRYECEVTLPPKTEWRISVNDSARPETANLVGQDNIHYEAILRNSQGSQAIQNSSATFATNPTQFVGWNLATNFSHLATDADGDSLVYSLAQPLANCNDPVPYKPLNATGYIDLSAQNNGNPCVATVPAGNTYSSTFPLASYTFTGNCPLKTAVPYFTFDATMGAMAFRPTFYTPNIVDAWQNNYVVVVKVDEYRRIGSSYTLVGSVRRDMVFVVVDCGTNLNPTLAPLRIGNSSTPVATTAVIPAVAGQLVGVQLTGGDANANQLVTLTSNAEQVLPNADFVASAPGTQPTAVLNWLPPASLPAGLYYCTITTTDNACPIKGVTQHTLTFRVTNTTLATKPARTVTALAAVPTPFRGQVSFRLAQAGTQPVFVFDQLGRQVAELKSQPSGEVLWQPGTQIAPGLYLARSADGRQVARLLRTDAE